MDNSRRNVDIHILQESVDGDEAVLVVVRFRGAHHFHLHVLYAEKHFVVQPGFSIYPECKRLPLPLSYNSVTHVNSGVSKPQGLNEFVHIHSDLGQPDANHQSPGNGTILSFTQYQAAGVLASQKCREFLENWSSNDMI